MTDAADRIKHKHGCSRRTPALAYDLITKCGECHQSAPNVDAGPGICEGCGGKCAPGRARCHHCKNKWTAPAASTTADRDDTSDHHTRSPGRQATLATCERLGVPLLIVSEHGATTIVRRASELTTTTRGETPSRDLPRTVGEGAVHFGTHHPLVSGGAQDG